MHAQQLGVAATSNESFNSVTGVQSFRAVRVVVNDLTFEGMGSRQSTARNLISTDTSQRNVNGSPQVVGGLERDGSSFTVFFKAPVLGFGATFADFAEGEPVFLAFELAVGNSSGTVTEPVASAGIRFVGWVLTEPFVSVSFSLLVTGSEGFGMDNVLYAIAPAVKVNVTTTELMTTTVVQSFPTSTAVQPTTTASVNTAAATTIVQPSPTATAVPRTTLMTTTTTTTTAMVPIVSSMAKTTSDSGLPPSTVSISRSLASLSLSLSFAPATSIESGTNGNDQVTVISIESIAAIVGGTVGGICLLTAIALIIVARHRRRHRVVPATTLQNRTSPPPISHDRETPASVALKRTTSTASHYASGSSAISHAVHYGAFSAAELGAMDSK